MASLKHGVQPNLMRLEGRAQPGSMFSTGLDGSILAGALFGDTIVKASRPALVTAKVPTRNADMTEIAMSPATRPLSWHTNGTIKQAVSRSIEAISGLTDQRVFATLAEYVRANPGLEQRPGDFDGTRGPNLLNYNGDFDDRNGLANEFNTQISDARVFDGFRIRTAPIKDCFFSHNLMTGVNATTANVTILGPGFITGGIPNGGLPVLFHGSNLPATQVPTGLSGFGITEFEVKVCGLGLNFNGGHYYVNVQPIGNGAGRSFNSSTSGLAHVGSGQNGTVGEGVKGGPGINDDSWFDSPYFGVTFGDTGDFLPHPPGTWDFSIGICRPPGC